MEGFVRCSMEACGGQCCRGGGVYLEEDDIRRIRWALRNVEDLNAGTQNWLGELDGEKILQTRDGNACLFLDDDGCRLEKAAGALGMDRWALKPLACWLFPMWEGADGRLNSPPESGSAPEQMGISDEDRKMRADFYSTMPCGRRDPCGRPAEEAFAPEIARWREEAGRRTVRESLKEMKCSLGVGPRGPGVFALVDMKKDEDPAPSPGRARDIVRIDTVDVSEEMGVRDAIARAASGYAVTKPDGSRWARPMESGLVDIAFLVEEGPKPEANVEWDWEQFRLRLTRDVHAGEELRLAAVGETGE